MKTFWKVFGNVFVPVCIVLIGLTLWNAHKAHTKIVTTHAHKMIFNHVLEQTLFGDVIAALALAVVLGIIGAIVMPRRKAKKQQRQRARPAQRRPTARSGR